MERQHSLLNPSSSNIWSTCTPSARFAEKFEKKESDYAEEGTLCHFIATDLILFRLKRISSREYFSKLKLYKQHRLYQPEMLDYANQFADYVFAIYDIRKMQGPTDIIIEATVDFSGFVPDGYGHLDVSILTDDAIEVIDLKYGKGVSVSAIMNPQLLLYGLGAILSFEFFYTQRDLHLHIFQPRIDNVSIYNTTVKECLQWAESFIKPKAQLAFEGKGEYVAGSHCRFCAAAPRCKALHDHNLSLAKYDFILPHDLTNEQIAEALALGEELINWYSTLKEYANAEARKGANFPGYKLVEGRSVRRYKELKSYANLHGVLKSAGFLQSQYMELPKLIGITAMEKLLGKQRFEKLLSKFIEQPPGTPVLVPESNKKVAIHGIEGAKRDFKNIKL